MTDALTIALIGAGGAVLGSAVSVLPTLLLERSRARRQERADQALARQDLQEAGRLVAEELREARRQIESAAQRDRYWPGLAGLPTSAWETYRPAISRQLTSPVDWGVVAEAFDRVMRLNNAVRERRGRMITVQSRTEGEPVADEDDLKDAWAAVSYALWLLDCEVGIPVKAEDYLAHQRQRERELWPDTPTRQVAPLS